MNIEKFIQEQLQAKKDEIVRNSIAEVHKTIEQCVQWALSSKIEQYVRELFDDEEVHKTLEEGVNEAKKKFIELFSVELNNILPIIVAEMAKQLQQRAIKNLSGGNYKLSGLYKEIFS